MSGRDPASLVSTFLAQTVVRGDAPALRSKKEGVWRPVSWREWEKRSRAVAAHLVEAGVAAGDRVAIFGTTREEWLVADLGVMMAGAVTVPVYPSLIGEQAAYILGDSGAKALFAEDASYVKRIAEHDAAVVARLARTWHFAELPEGDPQPALSSQVDERIAAGESAVAG